jgi:hypothetical protein
MEMTRQALGHQGWQGPSIARRCCRKKGGWASSHFGSRFCVERLLPQEEDAERLDAEEYIERPDEFWESNERTVVHLANDHDHPVERRAGPSCRRIIFSSILAMAVFVFVFTVIWKTAHRDRCLSERENSGSLFKNTALLWCQTVVRLCKRTQLKQKLDHYRDGDDAETS